MQCIKKKVYNGMQCQNKHYQKRYVVANDMDFSIDNMEKLSIDAGFHLK